MAHTINDWLKVVQAAGAAAILLHASARALSLVGTFSS